MNPLGELEALLASDSSNSNQAAHNVTLETRERGDEEGSVNHLRRRRRRRHERTARPRRQQQQSVLLRWVPAGGRAESPREGWEKGWWGERDAPSRTASFGEDFSARDDAASRENIRSMHGSVPAQEPHAAMLHSRSR
jgi:hypothetical protein